MVLNLDISRYSNEEPYVNCIKYSTLKAILFTETSQAPLPFEINLKIRTASIFWW